MLVPGGGWWCAYGPAEDVMGRSRRQVPAPQQCPGFGRSRKWAAQPSWCPGGQGEAACLQEAEGWKPEPSCELLKASPTGPWL